MAKNKPTARKPRPATTKQREHADAVYRALDALYPDAHCALVHRNAFELLVATILSAQCTDERVNRTTPALFEAYPTPEKMAKAPPAKIEALIRSTGFFRNKAKNIIGASRRIVDAFGGDVPETMDELLTLPGVARKTANVVLGDAFETQVGVVVDTHVGRLSYRLGLTKETTPTKVERDLMRRVDRPRWTQLAHLLIAHGRAVCSARRPDCDGCKLSELCPRRGVT